VDDATVIHQKEYAVALSIVLTLQIPQVIEKLDDILRQDIFGMITEI
jgi:hypothetical protein